MLRNRNRCPNRTEWYSMRDKLYEEIMTNAWNEEKGFFCQSYEDKVRLVSSPFSYL